MADTEELVVAVDSRLRFGRRWDCCPKLFALPRSDAVICFAGDTSYAYPIIEQLRVAVDSYPRSRTRAMDIGAMRGHLLRVMTDMMRHIGDLPRVVDINDDAVDTLFVLAGYSWLTSSFKIWTVYFDRTDRTFHYRSAGRWRNDKVFTFEGDEIREARRRLYALLQNRGRGADDGLDMEPFEVLRDMCRDRRFPTIGGAPQILKVYRHMNTMPYAVFWPDRESGILAVLGRPLLDYERTQYLALDPDTLETSNDEENGPAADPGTALPE